MDIKGKTVILTGARRIGQTVAEELAKKGANLAITYRGSAEESEAVCSACNSIGIKSKAFQADLTKFEDIKNLVESVKTEFGQIDILIHMAAIYKKTPWESLTEDDFDLNFNIITKSTFLLSKFVGDEMLKNSGEIKGKIVTISDWSVLTSPYKDYLPYNAAKAAVEGLTKSLAKELAPSITVNAVAPGPILRPADLSDSDNEEAMKRTPLRRWGGAEEIAKAILYLLDSDFITGVILPVDGGRSIG